MMRKGEAKAEFRGGKACVKSRSGWLREGGGLLRIGIPGSHAHALARTGHLDLTAKGEAGLL